MSDSLNDSSDESRAQKYRIYFLTLFKIGYFKSAPGTWGSLVGLLIALPILYYSSATLFLLAVLVGIIAIKQIDIFEAQTMEHDTKSIVIDELVGIWIALAIAQWNVFSIALSFIFFRIYDIKKPSIIGRIDEKIEGGLGVVGDDVLAGFFAGISALVVLGVLNLIFGVDVGFTK